MNAWGTFLVTSVSVAAAASCGDDSNQGSTGSSASSGSSALSSATGSTGGSPSSSSVTSGGGSGGQAELPQTFRVRGIVTDGDAPLEGASVLQGGGEVQQVTGPDGAFDIEMTTALPGIPTVVAGKIGYRAGGEEIYELPQDPLEILVRLAAPPDNEGYTFGDPGNGDPAHDNSTAYCGHCHTTFVETFQGSGHQNATKDPWVQDLYAGVASSRSDLASCAEAGGVTRQGQLPGTPEEPVERCYVGDGVLPDLNDCGDPGDEACDDPDLAPAQQPVAFGQCADCHAAGMDGPAGGRDLLDATGLAFEQGNSCDVCHHVSDIDLDAPPGTGGRLVLQRPRERIGDEPGSGLRQVMFGPLLDVPNGFMGGSYQPKFMEATFCAGCHEHSQQALVPGTELDAVRWPDGLPIHSTFSEWSESDYATAGAPCQTCHMPPLAGMFNSLDSSDPETAGAAAGFGRSPERNRSHAFVGALQGSPRMIDTAIAMALEVTVSSTLDVAVDVTNFGAGHAVPTGEPMRSLLLVIQAEACGDRLDAVGGNSLADTGGSRARGVVGAEVGVDGSWAEGATLAQRGDRLRVTRPTGEYLDYPGVGAFAEPSLSPEEKGVPVDVPVQDVEVIAAAGDLLVTNPPLELSPGDVVWLGEPPELSEGAAARALAGMPGQDFARITVDAASRRHVPHHRAVDLASDHRIPPNAAVTSSHAFELPAGCSEAWVTATLLYRRSPLPLARERGWDLVEHVVASSTRRVALP